jgi:hypothetical protein
MKTKKLFTEATILTTFVSLFFIIALVVAIGKLDFNNSNSESELFLSENELNKIIEPKQESEKSVANWMVNLNKWTAHNTVPMKPIMLKTDISESDFIVGARKLNNIKVIEVEHGIDLEDWMLEPSQL